MREFTPRHWSHLKLAKLSAEQAYMQLLNAYTVQIHLVLLCYHQDISTLVPGTHKGKSIQQRFIENQTATPLSKKPNVMMFIDARACVSDVLIDDG